MVFSVIAFYAEWSRFRKGVGKYSLNHMGPCDIAIYSFATMDEQTFQIKIPNDSKDEEDLYTHYTEFIQYCITTNKKPILGLGGWVDSTKKYSDMLTNNDNRCKFVSSIVKHLKETGFKGLNLDIEYPTCPQADTINGNLADKQGFILLLRELKKYFNEYQWELSVCIPASASTIERAYDIEELNNNLDWIGVMTYDYNVSSGKKTGPISSIHDVKATVKYLIDKGITRNKLIIGVPFYGHRYSLESADHPGYGVPSKKQGPAGPCTGEDGILSYYEISNIIRSNNYTIEQDEDGVYAYKDTDFISFNSPRDIVKKIELMKENDLGGVMMWESSLDDFTGDITIEGQGKNPLMNFIWKHLKQIL